MKRGDQYESPSGLGFTVQSVTKKEITVAVDRVVRRNGKRVVETHTRVVPVAMWDGFAQAYKPIETKAQK